MAKHIFHIVDSFCLLKGGPTQSIIGLAKAQRKRGNKVSILSIKKPQKKSSIQCVSGYFEVSNYLLKKSLNIFFRKERTPYFVHFHGIWSLSLIIPFYICFFLKMRIFYHVRGMLEPWALKQNESLKKIAFIFYQKKILNLSDYVVCSTKQELQSVQLKNIIPKKQFIISPNGIGENILKKSSEFKDISITKWNKKKKYKFIFMSRIHPKKGLHIFLKAWNSYNFKNGELQICGNFSDKKYETQITKLISQNKNDNITLMGFVTGEDKKRLLSQSHFMILPSYSENFGNIILESLAMGSIPIISNKLPWDNLIKKKLIYAIENNANSIIKVLKLISDKYSDDYHLNKSISGISYSKNYSWNKIFINIKQFYEN